MATPSKAITFTTHSRQLSLSTHWLNHLVNSEELAHFPTERGICLRTDGGSGGCRAALGRRQECCCASACNAFGIASVPTAASPRRLSTA